MFHPDVLQKFDEDDEFKAQAIQLGLDCVEQRAKKLFDAKTKVRTSTHRARVRRPHLQLAPLTPTRPASAPASAPFAPFAPFAPLAPFAPFARV